MKAIPMLCALLLAPILVLSCSDQDVLTALSEETITGSAASANTGPPAASGPIVIRTETLIGFWYPDAKSGLSVTIGADDISFCTTGDPDFSIRQLQEVDIPDDANRVMDLIQGSDIKTTVWPFTTFDCDLFLNTEPVARGVSDLVSTDNDFFAFLTPDSPNSNAFGFAAEGKVTDSDGNSFLYRGHSRGVWDGVDFSSIKFEELILLIPHHSN